MELLGWWDANQLTGYANATDISTSVNPWFDSGPMGRGIQRPSVITLHPPTIDKSISSTVKFYKVTPGKLADSGLPGVEFHAQSGQGDAEALVNAKMSRALQTPFFVAFVCRPTVVQGASDFKNRPFALFTATGHNTAYEVDFTNHTGGVPSATWTGAGTLSPVVTSAHNPGTKQFLFTRNYQIGACPLYINGTVLGTVTMTALAPNNTYKVGWGVMEFASGGSGYTTLFFEMIVVDRVLNDSEREQIEGYLAHKWWAPGNIPLDPGHPYFAAPPGDGSFDFFYVQQTNQ